jgi:hypothetical protein
MGGGILNLIKICLFFHSLSHAKESSQVRGPVLHFVTFYSVCSQLSAISGGHVLHLQPEDAGCTILY